MWEIFFYWCATSTKQGFESLILTKWKSFVCYVANKHDDHPDSLFTWCAHGVLDPCTWIKIGIYIVMNLYLIVLVAFVSIGTCILYLKSSVKWPFLTDTKIFTFIYLGALFNSNRHSTVFHGCALFTVFIKLAIVITICIVFC